MIEQDNIRELFSKAFENQTAPVKPELWQGVQAKMVAAGVTSTGVAAVKGLSALSKWVIASASVVTAGAITTVVMLSGGEEQTPSQKLLTKQTDNRITSKDTDETKSVFTSNTVEKQQYETEITDKQTKKPIENLSDTYTDDDFGKITVNIPPRTDIIPSVSPNDNQKLLRMDDEGKKVSVGQAGSKDSSTDSKDEELNQGEHMEIKSAVVLSAKVTLFPNVFTPNGDGYNDYYQVKVENFKTFKLTILDQNNRVVFETTDLNVSWDGTVGGEPAKQGTYAAIVTGKDLDNKDIRDIQLFELTR